MQETVEEIIDLEREGWTALSTSGDAAARFYRDVLVDDPVMLLPGGMTLREREQIVETMQGVPWDAFELSDERVRRLGDHCAVVTYRGTASRGDQQYRALFSSTYVREAGRWRLAVHQQTPF